MANWNNLDTYAAYKELQGTKGTVKIAEAMAGEEGAARVKKYSAAMAADLAFNYGAKEVDDAILATMQKIADENFAVLYAADPASVGGALPEAALYYGV